MSFRNDILQEIQNHISNIEKLGKSLKDEHNELLIQELQNESRLLLDKLAVYRYLTYHFGLKENQVEKEEHKPNTEDLSTTNELLIDTERRAEGNTQGSIEENFIKDLLKSNIAKEDLNERLKKQAVSNLKNVIGLNEKILFVREFFNGDTEKYNRFIQSLNQAKDYPAAEQILEEYNIPRSKDAFQVLKDILEIRYS